MIPHLFSWDELPPRYEFTNLRCSRNLVVETETTREAEAQVSIVGLVRSPMFEKRLRRENLTPKGAFAHFPSAMGHFGAEIIRGVCSRKVYPSPSIFSTYILWCCSITFIWLIYTFIHSFTSHRLRRSFFFGSPAQF
jgi:hypothetical protein